MPKTNLSKKIVSMCKNGSVIIKIGKGKPKLLITAGIHGSEPGANIATLRFIEKIKNKKINGSIYIIPFFIPKDTSVNKRVWYNPKTKSAADPNRISNKVGTPGYNVVQFAKKNNITSIIDVHTGHGLSGYKNGFIFTNKNPTKKEKQWIKYIKKSVNPYIQYNSPQNGMIRSYSRNNGIDTITLEVEGVKGSFPYWANVEYKMLYQASKFFKIF
jgi:predicted deacylase